MARLTMALPDMFEMAARRTVRRPWIAVAVLLTLGVGIGLSTSLFAVLNAVIWRPLPVADPARLIGIETVAGGEADGVSPGLLFAWRDRARTLASVAGIRAANATLDDARGLERVAGAFVTAAYFDALGVPPARGRVFDAELDAPGREPVVVLSHRLWQRRYGGDDRAIGQPTVFNGRPRTIIGVMPPALDEISGEVEWWAPLALPDSQRANIGATYLDVVGRLQPGASAEAAQAELAAVTVAVGARADDGSLRGVRVTGLDARLSEPHRTTLLLLFGAVLVFLGIACANVANLLLADGLNRRSEMAVRASLGATRVQLLQQMALEALIVFACASAAGLLLAQWFTDALVAMLPPETPRLALVAIDGRTVIFALAAGLVSVCAGALVPALRGARVDAGGVLRARDAATGGGVVRLRRAFVVAQVALTVGLAAPGALLMRSAWSLERAPRGYDATATLTAAFSLPAATFPDGAAQSAGFERLLTVAREIGGVSSAAIATRVPLAGAGAGSDVARTDEAFGPDVDRQVRVRLVSPGYFTTLGIAMTEGRDFDERDTRTGRRVVIVNDTLARRLRQGPALAGVTAVKFALNEFNDAGRPTPWDVVGVVSDTFDAGPRRAAGPEIFVPLAQAPPEVFGWMGNQAVLALRGPGDLSGSIPALRAAIAGAGLKVPLYDVRTLSERFGAHLTRERVVSRLVSLLGAVGFLLSSLGLFAVITQLVRQRQRDTVLMLALGASPRLLIRRVMREGLVMAAAGLALGLAACLATAHLFRALLFGVGAADPFTLTAMAAALAVVTCLATWWPARSIASLDLVSVLREV
jgi:putative ABC transport system permease protein